MKKCFGHKVKIDIYNLRKGNTLTNRIQQNGGKMKKYFGNKNRTSDYNPRKEEH